MASVADFAITDVGSGALRESRKKTAGPGLSRTPAELQGLFALRFFDSLDDVGVRLANRRLDRGEATGNGATTNA